MTGLGLKTLFSKECPLPKFFEIKNFDDLDKMSTVISDSGNGFHTVDISVLD